VRSTRLDPLPGATDSAPPKNAKAAAIEAADAAQARSSDADDEGVGRPGRARSGSGGAEATGTGTDSAVTDPNSAYYIYTNDPSQAYRRHLTFKNNGITPGRILAARRKENAIQRAEALAAAAATAGLEGGSFKSGRSGKL
jgi:hypothetical protein